MWSLADVIRSPLRVSIDPVSHGDYGKYGGMTHCFWRSGCIPSCCRTRERFTRTVTRVQERDGERRALGSSMACNAFSSSDFVSASK